MEQLKERYKLDSNDDNPLDLMPELGVQRDLLELTLDRMLGGALQAQARQETNVLRIKSAGGETESVSSRHDGGMVVGGGGVSIDIGEDPLDITRAEFSPPKSETYSNKQSKPNMRNKNRSLPNICPRSIVNSKNN